MTTIHNKFTYVEDNKTEAHMFYNASKGEVDTFDQMCEHSDTERKNCALAHVYILWVDKHYHE